MSDPSQREPSTTPALRASDAEREHVIELLRGAAGEGRLDLDELDERLTRAYASRTTSELEALTADVVAPGAAAVAGAAGRPLVRPGAGGTGHVISIMGGHERRGHWRVAPRCTVINVMGGSDLDMTGAELSDAETTITVFSLMGGGELRVPDGAEVSVSKLAIMGANDVRLADRPAPAGAPVIHVRLLSIMAGFKVRQGPKRKRHERERWRVGDQHDPGPRLDPPTAALMEGAPPGGTADRTMPAAPHSGEPPTDAPGEGQVGNLPG